jgi:hypothetical protein
MTDSSQQQVGDNVPADLQDEIRALRDLEIGSVSPRNFNWKSLLVLTPFVAIAVVAAIYGWAEQRGWTTWPGVRQPILTITEGSAGSVLYSLRGNDWSQVLVQQPDAAVGWLLVSLDDLTAGAGSLSEDGSSVAYRSDLSDQAVVFVDLAGNQRTAIADSQIAAAGQVVNVSDLARCSWTPIEWSPDGKRAAFFTCSAQDMERSYIAIANVTYPLKSLSVITDSLVESGSERSIQWLGNQAVVTTITALEGQSPSQTTYLVP